jgi:hypothetical protein
MDTSITTKWEGSVSPPVHVKRSKIGQACEICRNRRVKCDGAKPACGACRRRRKPYPPCSYVEDRISHVSTDYVEHLEQRVKELESLQNNPAGPEDVVEDLLMSSDESNDDSKALDLASLDTLRADAMGNFTAADPDLPVAASSAASFMDQVKTALTTRLSTLPSQSEPAAVDLPDPWTDPRLNLLERNRTEIFSLPSRTEADKMLALYWAEIHALYPFLLQARFEEAYRRLWSRTKNDTSDVPTYCITNLVFALHSQFTKKDSPKEKAALADLYYRRAALLLQTSGIGRCSQELLQALLLMSQFLHSTEWPRRCWVITGQAIRTAQALGLHIPSITSRLPQQDRELSRRLWHGCVFFDRMISMALGRPMVLSRADAEAVPLPSEIDDAHLSPVVSMEGVQPPGTMPRASFFVHAMKLVGLLDRVLSTLYSADLNESRRTGRSSVERLESLDFGAIVQIDAAFRKWEEAVPSELRLGDESIDSTDLVIFRQARVLRLRYERSLHTVTKRLC